MYSKENWQYLRPFASIQVLCSLTSHQASGAVSLILFQSSPTRSALRTIFWLNGWVPQDLAVRPDADKRLPCLVRLRALSEHRSACRDDHRHGRDGEYENVHPFLHGLTSLQDAPDPVLENLPAPARQERPDHGNRQDQPGPRATASRMNAAYSRGFTRAAHDFCIARPLLLQQQPSVRDPCERDEPEKRECCSGDAAR